MNRKMNRSLQSLVPWWLRSPETLVSHLLGCSNRDGLDSRHIMLIRYDPNRDVYYQLREPGWYTLSRARFESGLRLLIDRHLGGDDVLMAADSRVEVSQLIEVAFNRLRESTAMQPGEELELLEDRVYL